ncbi:hypothetical protein ACLSZM_07875, partial [Avibacterium avium]
LCCFNQFEHKKGSDSSQNDEICLCLPIKNKDYFYMKKTFSFLTLSLLSITATTASAVEIYKKDGSSVQINGQFRPMLAIRKESAQICETEAREWILSLHKK